MLTGSPIGPIGAVLWHPLGPGAGAAVAPWLAALAIGALGIAAASVLPFRPPSIRPLDRRPFDAWEGELDGPRWAGRAVGVALVAVAVVAGRVGHPDQLRNLAPSLVIGAGWPLAVLVCAALGPAWRWMAPIDSMARLSAPDGQTGIDVRPALLSAAAWTWYLAAFDRGLDPRPLGFALGLYVVLHLAACLGLGRRRWLASGEVFGLFLGWTGRLPSGALATWTPPRGAAAVLGVLGGGVAFAAFRRSGTWVEWTAGTSPLGWSSGGVAVAAVAVAVALWSFDRWAGERGAVGVVPAAAVPVVAAAAVAVALVSYRLTTSAQLALIHASDPFGLGWNLFGTASWRVNARPVAHATLETIQLAILAAGVVAAGVVASRRARGPARGPAVATIALLGASSAYCVAAAAV